MDSSMNSTTPPEGLSIMIEITEEEEILLSISDKQAIYARMMMDGLVQAARI